MRRICVPIVLTAHDKIIMVANLVFYLNIPQDTKLDHAVWSVTHRSGLLLNKKNNYEDELL